MTHFHVGSNMVGYMPDSDPFVTDDYDSAKRYLIDELNDAADLADINGPTEEGNGLSLAAEDVNVSGSDGGYGEVIGNYSYWIEPCTMAECEVDDE